MDIQEELRKIVAAIDARMREVSQLRKLGLSIAKAKHIASTAINPKQLNDQFPATQIEKTLSSPDA
jgi:hypothetical protein